MTSTDSCTHCLDALHESFLRREALREVDASHLETCPSCRNARAELTALALELESLACAAAPDDALVARVRREARLELAETLEVEHESERARATDTLPRGFGRECARLLAAALAALPVVLLWNGLVLEGARRLLAGVLPEPVLGALGGAYLASVAGWLAFLYGSIPIVAHRRARLLEEATS